MRIRNPDDFLGASAEVGCRLRRDFSRRLAEKIVRVDWGLASLRGVSAGVAGYDAGMRISAAFVACTVVLGGMALLALAEEDPAPTPEAKADGEAAAETLRRKVLIELFTSQG